MLVILIAGYSESGKNTMGDYLENTYGFRQYAFANALKQIVSKEYNFPLEWTYTHEGKKTKINDLTVRELLLKRGQELRKDNPGFFAEKVAESILQDSAEKCVITDWRLPIELETLQSFLPSNYQIHKVCIHKKTQLQSPVNHWTENSLEGLNIPILFNPGDRLETFYKFIDEFVNPILQ